MSWIKRINYEQAEGKLKSVYDRYKNPGKPIDNVLTVHSLRPHTLDGHMQLYKNVLHHAANTLPLWYLELIGVYVSHLNSCNYCVEHHMRGLIRGLKDETLAIKYRKALESDRLETTFSRKDLAGLRYAGKLTMAPERVMPSDLQDCRDSGFDEGEILEINQVTGYFNYANRTVLGLGVNLDGDVLEYEQLTQ